MAYTQENRLMAIATPLGDDTLLLSRFSGVEGISRMFHFDLELRSTSESIDFDSIVGKNVTLRLTLAADKDRFFNGIISRFSQSGREHDLITYQAEMVPWFWFLTRTSDCRIFQRKKVPDIIKQIFDEHQLKDYKFQLYGSYLEREYCVQYRETDFNFVSRLLEEEGIFYFFTHENGVHTMVLADDPTANKPCPNQPQARYDVTTGAHQGEDVVLDWQVQQELRSGVYVQSDYYFEQPNSRLRSSVNGKSNFEIYDFHPGEYKKMSEGDALVRTRLQEIESPAQVARAVSDCRAFSSGYRFDLKEHYREDMNQTWLITAAQHTVTQPGDFRSSTSSAAATEYYRNQLECIPYSAPFRPPRVTPHPVVQGAQTAVVVGPAGEEIFTDKYGRVKVQFHWDREGKEDEDSSCWIRVSQTSAGKRWGALFLPRIGQEVIVEFLEGDPDQPIISGCVYNAEQMPPYALPDHKTRSTLKTYSSKGGGGFNEFRFEDAKGSEQIFIHAERNQDIRVKKDLFETTGGECHRIVKKDHFEKIGGDVHLTVSGDQNEKVDGTVSLKADMDYQAKIGMNHAVDAGMEIHLKAGMNIVLESGAALTLKVGGSFINLNPGGVFISGPMVMINSGGTAGSGSGSSPEAAKIPQEADTSTPGEKAAPTPPPTLPKRPPYSAAATVMKHAAKSGTPFCAVCSRANPAI